MADNNIGAGTISIIVDEYKNGLDNFDLDSFRELTLEAKKRGMSPSDLASFFRLYNFFRGSGAKESEIESFKLSLNGRFPSIAFAYSSLLAQVSALCRIAIRRTNELFELFEYSFFLSPLVPDFDI